MLCVLPPLSLPGFLMSLETICEPMLSCTYLCWGQTPHVSSLSAAVARLAGCLLVGPGKSSRARICLKMLGVCLNTTFHQTRGFFSGCGEQHLLLHWIPVQQRFISYLCHTKEDLLVLLGSGSAACALMRSGAHH